MDEATETPKQSSNNMMSIVGVIVILLVIAGVFLFMQNGKSEQVENSEDQAMPANEEPTEGIDTEKTVKINENAQMTEESEVRVIDVEAGSFYYKPSLMKVKKGETVRIVLKAVSMMHDFNIDELGVKLPIVKDGDTGTVEFVADKVGSFEYYCSVANHRAQGQVGMITVE
ncbi:MAG: cupredoxin domain-containing protein [Candidatus Roizmanbacteria bacterium]|nr:cupredoxin domain-containing protein [Candidatus Roizmanbacteria bacterium]